MSKNYFNGNGTEYKTTSVSKRDTVRVNETIGYDPWNRITDAIANNQPVCSNYQPEDPIVYAPSKRPKNNVL